MGPGEDEIARIQVRRVLLLGGTRASIGRLVAAAAVLALLLAGLPGGGSAAVRASLYTPNPTVTGVTPTTGPRNGGTTVTISGANLTGATAVNFGGTPAASFMVVSDTKITAVSPPGHGTVDVTVTTSGGTSAATPADHFRFLETSKPLASLLAPAARINSATLSGFVYPGGLPTTAQFVLSPDGRYKGFAGGKGPRFSKKFQIPGNVRRREISVKIAGLLPNVIYRVRLVVTNANGTGSSSRTFRTKKDPPPGVPTIGETVNVYPVSGLVFIKLPGSKPAGDPFELGPLQKGNGFTLLTEPRQVALGSTLDTRQGTVQLGTATASPGKLQFGIFSGAIFTMSQMRASAEAEAPGEHEVVPELDELAQQSQFTVSLDEDAFPGAPSFNTCKAHPSSDQMAGVAKSSVLQTLHAHDNHGSFRTHGRYSSGTVRGTTWTTTDRCDGTLTTVQRGSVTVLDFGTRQTITLNAGQSFLARP
jgi:hypothetical protein